MKASRWRWDNVPIPEAHVAALAAAGLAHVVLPVRVPLGRRFAQMAGWPIAFAGAGLAAWAVTSATAAGVGVDQPSKLVTNGAFEISRNPMYLGWSIAAAGVGIVTRSPWVLAATSLAAAATHREVLDEEAGLSVAFGAEYAAYVDATPRYVGGVWLRPMRAWLRPSAAPADLARRR
jgi:protein-S-isoprenylcysteine O-methyltransferase Ste14